MLRQLSNGCKEMLLADLVFHFNNNIVKDEWRVIKIVPIPKPNRNLNDIKNFRPISLLSVIVKTSNMIRIDL